ncbi:putative TOG domain, importin beta family protein [Tanacetum coccineum]
MSSSNDQRSQAETLFNLSKQTDPNSLFSKLCHVLHHSQRVESRAMSAILFRKQLTQDDFLIWNEKLTPKTKHSIKSVLLNSITKEKVKSILKKLCDTESALLIFAQLAQFIGESLVAYIANLHGVFVRCLASGSVDVRIAALSGVVNFVQCLGVSDRDSSTVRFSNITSSTGAGLYLKTKYLYVREKVEDNSIVIEYISTHDMLAYPLTKGLPPKLFLEHVAGMGLCDSQI